jgi:hypothetical protein
MSTVPQITAGRDGSADHSRLWANWPRNVLMASGPFAGVAHSASNDSRSRHRGSRSGPKTVRIAHPDDLIRRLIHHCPSVHHINQSPRHLVRVIR